MQRFWAESLPGVFKEQQDSHCGWRERRGEERKVWFKREPGPDRTGPFKHKGTDFHTGQNEAMESFELSSNI